MVNKADKCEEDSNYILYIILCPEHRYIKNNILYLWSQTTVYECQCHPVVKKICFYTCWLCDDCTPKTGCTKWEARFMRNRP